MGWRANCCINWGGVELPLVELSLASLAVTSLALVVAATKEKYRG